MLTTFSKKIVASNWFNRFITGIIIVASILVGLHTYPELNQKYHNLFHLLDNIILVIFIFEIAIKMLALGKKPWAYFKDPWNVFDFSIVVLCLLPSGSGIFAVFRLARVLRVLRLVTALPKLQVLVGALINSIPSIGYIGILLGLHFYVYSVIGTIVFAKNDPVHFGSLHRSAIALFGVVTLEGWVELMNTQIYGSDIYPVDNLEHIKVEPTAHPIAAPIFFISFIVLGTMIILNLFIGVIMNGMNEMENQRALKEHLKRKKETNIISLESELKEVFLHLEKVKEQLNMVDQLVNSKQDLSELFPNRS